MIYGSPYPDIHVPTDLSVSQFLVKRNPDDVSPKKLIVSDFDNPSHSLTYGELRTRAAQGAAALIDQCGLRVGDVVCIYAQNSVNWLLLAHSVWWSGCCTSAINPLSTPYELVHYFEVAKPKVVVVDAALLPRVQEALQSVKLKASPSLVVLEDFSKHATGSLPRFPRDFIKFQTRSLPPYNLKQLDNRKVPAAMCFSSGTSGKPKGVVMSHHNLIAQMLTARGTNPLAHSSHNNEVFFPSFSHIYGMVSAVLMAPYAGYYLVVMKQFDFMPYLRRSVEIRSSMLRLVPALAIRMTKDPEVRNLDLRSVQTLMVSGAALSSETVQQLQAVLGSDAAVLNGYGMTEATVTMLRETQSHRAGSLGKPAASTSVRIVDDDYRDVAPGQDGECLVKAPTVFMEYKDNPAETRATFRDGWLCTGDIVCVDEDGYFWMTGRKKELIKYKGNQVAPAELESVLLSHPLVVDAGVCGIYDEKLETEVPMACVVLAAEVSSEAKTLEDIRAFVDAKVAPYKRLRGGIYAAKALPKGTTGKLLRRELPALVGKGSQPKAKL